MRKVHDMELRHRFRLRPGTTPGQERAAQIVVAVYVLAFLASTALWLLSASGPHRFLTVVLALLNIPVSGSLVSVVLLALITGALLRRKRAALLALVAFQVLGTVWSVAAPTSLTVVRAHSGGHADGLWSAYVPEAIHWLGRSAPGFSAER